MRRVIWYSTPANVDNVRSNPVDFSKTAFTWGVKCPNKPFDERCRPKPAPKSQVLAGFDAEEVVAPLQPIVAPMLLRPMSSRTMAVAPYRAPDSSRRNMVACGATAMSKCVVSNSTDVPVRVTRSLNWVVRPPRSTALEIESNAMLYSVRPNNNEVPKGVNFNDDGMVKFELV